MLVTQPPNSLSKCGFTGFLAPTCALLFAARLASRTHEDRRFRSGRRCHGSRPRPHARAQHPAAEAPRRVARSRAPRLRGCDRRCPSCDSGSNRSESLDDYTTRAGRTHVESCRHRLRGRRQQFDVQPVFRRSVTQAPHPFLAPTAERWQLELAVIVGEDIRLAAHPGEPFVEL